MALESNRTSDYQQRCDHPLVAADSNQKPAPQRLGSLDSQLRTSTATNQFSLAPSTPAVKSPGHKLGNLASSGSSQVLGHASTAYAPQTTDIKGATSVKASMSQSLFSNLCWGNTCTAFLNEFQRHARRLRMCRKSKGNCYWPIFFGTSPWFSSKSINLLIIRALIALIFLGHFAAILPLYFDEGYYFIYLAHWALLVQVAYFCFAAYTAYAARVLLTAGPLDGNLVAVYLPWFVRATWSLQHIALPAALCVCILYWGFENGAPAYLNVFTHGINFLLLLVDLFAGRNVFYLKHSILFFMFVCLYFLWSVIHFATGIGTYDGCEKYIDEECPIYDMLDWHRITASSAIVFIVVFCLAPLCQYPLWCLVHKRRVADSYFNRPAEKRIPEPATVGVPEASE